jgi:hypothetical protein
LKKILRLVALILVVGSLALWAATGMNRGWTKTSVPRKTLDEVTGIEGITYEKHFVPGVDFLGVSVLGAVVLTGLSFLYRTKPK